MIVFEVTCSTAVHKFEGLFTRIPSTQELKEALHASLVQISPEEFEDLNQLRSDLYRELEGGRFYTRERYVQEL